MHLSLFDDMNLVVSRVRVTGKMLFSELVGSTWKSDDGLKWTEVTTASASTVLTLVLLGKREGLLVVEWGDGLRGFQSDDRDREVLNQLIEYEHGRGSRPTVDALILSTGPDFTEPIGRGPGQKVV